MTTINTNPTTPLWSCPFCHQGLTFNPENKSWGCSKNHHFDCARQGYVNLLPPNKKHSIEPGDNSDMITARRRVHEADVYRPLANLINTQLIQLPTAARILDMGCGEGYYSGAMQHAHPEAIICAVDISKPAIKIAAKHYPRINFAVASTFQLPLVSNSQNLIVRIFAPANDDEIRRVLTTDGHYLEVSPAPQHLWALREALYDIPKPHQPARNNIPGLTLEKSEILKFTVTLNQNLLHNLIAMTPFAHRGHREKREALLNRKSLKLDMAFSVSLFKKALETAE